MNPRALKRMAWIAALSLAITAPIAAQPGFRGHGGPGGRGMHGPHGGNRALAEYLQLTDEQKDAWKTAYEAHRTAVEPIFEQLRTNRETFQSAVEAQDATAIGNAFLAGEALRQQLQTEQQNLEAQLKAVLTADQLDKYEAFQAARGGRGGHRGPFGRGPGHGPGPGGPGPGGNN